ncbi:MAG: LysR substrate-binding domain-containing protein [Bacteroidales bacterium]
MTLQQMEYIVAVDQYRHFARAAESCGVTQSTLSSMIQKLEAELDMLLFDRNTHPVKPTLSGEEIIRQAKVVLYHASQLKEMALSEHHLEKGEIKLGIIPTIAPYILPRFFKKLYQKHPDIQLRVIEAHSTSLMERLERAELDMAILTAPAIRADMLEIPLYREKLLAYVSMNEALSAQAEINIDQLPSDHLWVLQEGHCLRNQVLNFCEKKSDYAAIYEAGSIETLVKIVDENGGYTIIPEFHVQLLRKCQQKQIRRLVNPEPFREIVLMIRKDYVRERMLNIIADTLRDIIPDHMVNERLKRFAIRL